MTYILEADEMAEALTSWSDFYNMVSKSNFSDTGILRAVAHYLPELKRNVSTSMEIPLSEVSVSPDDIAGAVSELIEYYAEHKKGETEMINIDYTKLIVPDNDYTRDECWTAEDIKRIESGDLYFIGIKAEANIRHTVGNVTTTYTLTSAGLWGVQSGAPEYEDEIFNEQVQELKELFEAMKGATQ